MSCRLKSYRQDLSNIPPLDLNNIDILKLMQQIHEIKSQVTLLTSMQTDVMDTVAKLGDNKNKTVIDTATQSHVTATETTHGGHREDTILTVPVAEEAITIDVSQQDRDQQQQDDVAHSGSEQVDNAEDELNHTSTDSTHLYVTRSEAECSMDFHPESGRRPSFSSVPGESVAEQSWKEVAHNRREKPVTVSTPVPNNRAAQRSYRDAVVDSQVVYGAGPGIGIKAVKPKPNKDSFTGNRVITGAFITRLDPKTTETQIQTHVWKETGVVVRAEKLVTKYNGYSSFHIRGDKRLRDILISSDLWPVGTLVKPFKA